MNDVSIEVAMNYCRKNGLYPRLEEHDKQIRAELIEELRNRHIDDNSWCEYTIDVIADELEEIVELLKEKNND